MTTEKKDPEIADNKVLADWVQLYTDDMYRYAKYKVSNPEVASDLVQDTFLAAAENLGTFKGNSSPKTWLFSILNNKIVDHYRKKVKQPVAMEEQVFSNFFDSNDDWQVPQRPKDWKDSDDKHILDDHEFQLILTNCLDALPEKWCICIKLKYLLGKNGDEICQVLEITSSNFWQIIHRAKLQLRDCVEKNWNI